MNALVLLVLLFCIVVLYFKSGEPESDVVTIDRVRYFKHVPAIFFVDVRREEEVRATGLIPGSINIPMNNLRYALIELSYDDFKAIYERDPPSYFSLIVFTGHSENHCKQAMKIARALGYRVLKYYPGGWTEWILENPSEDAFEL